MSAFPYIFSEKFGKLTGGGVILPQINFHMKDIYSNGDYASPHVFIIELEQEPLLCASADYAGNGYSNNDLGVFDLD